MSEHFVKPGNLERGWNDPPVFSYRTQNAARRGGTPLTKRVPPPQLTGGTTSIASPQASLTPASTLPPRVAPPPSVAPPPGEAPPATKIPQAEEFRVEEVLETLTSLLTECRGHVQGRVCDDIGRKLELLQEAWNSGKLSDLVRRRLGMLANDLRAGKWTESECRIVSLTVDHTGEVGPFMAAIRKLLSEARSLSFQQQQQETPMEPCHQEEPQQPLLVPQQTEQPQPLQLEQDPEEPDPKLDLPSEQHPEQSQSELKPRQEQAHSQPEPDIQQLESVQLEDQLPSEQRREQGCLERCDQEQTQPEAQCGSEPLPKPDTEVKLEDKPKSELQPDTKE